MITTSKYLNYKWNISNIYRKNKDDIVSLLTGRYPDFVYSSKNILPKGEIPVFTLHSVNRRNFENYLIYLSENNYTTITPSEFYNFLIGKIEPKSNTIMLTFDDGLRSLWSTAFPLLKKYGFSAVCFIVPLVINEDEDIQYNLEDVWAGKTSLEEIDKRENISPFCNWNEIKIMQKSGVIDFQSHTYGHNSIYIGNTLVDFVNPAFETNFIYSNYNPLKKDKNKLELGTPVYKWGSNMSEINRFIEDESLTQECIKFVQINNNIDFFKKSRWRKTLSHHFHTVQKKLGDKGRFQNFEERKEDIRFDLFNSKKLIEEKLDKEVSQLCYPWGLGSKLSVEISKDCGFNCNYWGHLNKKNINKKGDDPFYITRIFYENYIYSLPGNDRVKLSSQIKYKFDKHILKKQTNLSINYN